MSRLGLERVVDICYVRGQEVLTPIVDSLTHAGVAIHELCMTDEVDLRHLTVTVGVRDEAALERSVNRLGGLPGVNSVEIVTER